MTPTVTPAPPSTAQYSLSALNRFPSVSPSTVPAGATFVPTNPQQPWFDPMAVELVAAGDGEVPLSYGSYQVEMVGADPVWVPFTLAASQAAVPNMPTSAQIEAANLAGEPTLALPGYSGVGAIPIPQRQLLPTETIIPGGIPGSTVTSWNVGNTANGYVPAGSTPAGSTSVETEILEGVQEIEGALNLPKT
jgi:hypothetical protein